MSANNSPEIREFLASGEYTLNYGVLFVPGVLRGAIYDLNTGRVYSVNKSACQILTSMTEDEEFWGKLESVGLATKEKNQEKSILPEILQEPSLQFVWFEIISDDCNESCIHCYADSMPPSHRKEIGIKADNFIPLNSIDEKNTSRKLTNSEWILLIEHAYSLGCRRCQFIGGEPFVYKGENRSDVLDLAEHAKKLGFDFVEIFTNATMLTQEKIARIKSLGINIAVSLYSKDPEIHDKITNTPGSFNKALKSLKLLKEIGVPTRVETVLMKPNEQTIEETQEFVDEMGFAHKHPDVLRPKGRGDNPKIIPSKEAVVQYVLMTSPNFAVDKETLSRYVSGHSCLLGKITITDSGDILPCIFSRNLAVGNVLSNSLEQIIVGQKLETIWRNTKDDVLVCQDCEYRYVCFDCRPLSDGINQGKGEYLSTPYPRCTYNPYTGEWAKGVWRLDKEGKPYYNESLEPVIKEVMANQKTQSTEY